ncbi:FAD-binding oxidoreductase [Streptomyces sp. NBC_01187]|uniref:FAD-binding oxidoreductase n=1 Tax=Streptomyces sp. NBC_01187 TaxID=2903766 RepID=UPI00386E16AC|nr:hybrid-cluster NAD(P)-dependent oxidoreductase [Streptomyces sp. NBC_01187]
MNNTLTLPGAESLEPLARSREEDGSGDQLLVCKHVQYVTSEMKTFVFEPTEPRLFRHDPGQYLVFTFEIDGQQVDRCYTISSPPSRPNVAAITVKRVPGGQVSNWLHDHLTPGDTVRARGPLGQFSMARHPAPAYLFLSGGSGITPLMSMTRTLYDLASPADVVFLHSARTPDDIPFRQELELIAGTMPAIRVVHVCEDVVQVGEDVLQAREDVVQVGEDDGQAPGWHGHRGRLTLGMLRQIAPDFPEREVFTCGPPGYMRAVRQMLFGAGFPVDRYHQESFEAGVSDSASLRTADEPDRAAKFAVELSRSGTTIECDAGTPVLEAAARAGITLPSSCGEGLCGSCMTTLEAGSVDMRHNGGIRPRDTARNKILLCCSTPLENLVIDA